jgi:hypothetical protein
MFDTKTPTAKFQWRLPATQRAAISVALVLIFLPASMPGQEAPAADGDNKDSSPRVSTFALPRTLNEGRDPFHPTSTRVIAMDQPVKKADTGPATLELKGISGTVDRPLAIINNATMAVGEELDVTTPQGRVKVVCLAIEGTKVKIRAQGETRELLLRKGI